MKLPYSERGEGPPVLLLHAGVADRRMWDEHLEPLAAPGHRVLAPDLPGFGEAGPPQGPVAHWDDVVETMDALGIERAGIVGCSFGAQVALRVAAVHPQRVSSLALFSISAIPEPDPSPELLAAWEAEEAAVEVGEFERAAEAAASSWVAPGAPPEVRERVARMQRENYARHASEQAEFAPDPLEEDPGLLAAIACPVLLAAGERDMADFRDAVAELAAKLADASTTELTGCGHLAPLEAPEEFRRLVLANL